MLKWVAEKVRQRYYRSNKQAIAYYNTIAARVEPGKVYLWLDPYVTPCRAHSLFRLCTGPWPVMRGRDWLAYGCESPWLVTQVAKDKWALTDLWLGMTSVVHARNVYDMVCKVSWGPGEKLMPGYISGQYQG